MNENMNANATLALTQVEYDIIKTCIFRGVPILADDLVAKLDNLVIENQQMYARLTAQKTAEETTENTEVSE